jgi:hypothetical protein
MPNADRMRRRTPVAALAFVLAIAACGESATGPESGTVIAYDQGVSFQVTDTAVVVDGTTRARLAHPGQGLRIYHSTSYEYGGLGSYAPDRVWNEQWFSRFGYELERVERGDTVVFEFLDFGTVTMAQDDSLLKLTDTPDVSNAPYPVEFVNFVTYAKTHYAWRLELNGAEITFVESPYLERMKRGEAIALSATGGPRTEAFQASFAIDVLPQLTGIDNGGSVSFRSERPVIDAGRDLGISFEGLVDPTTTVFALLPWFEDVTDPERRWAATLVGQLPTATERAIIPAEVLTGLLDAAGVDQAGFVLYVIRVVDAVETIAVQRLDTASELELGVGYMDDTRLFIRLTR